MTSPEFLLRSVTYTPFSAGSLNTAEDPHQAAVISSQTFATLQHNPQKRHCSMLWLWFLVIYRRLGSKDHPCCDDQPTYPLDVCVCKFIYRPHLPNRPSDMPRNDRELRLRCFRGLGLWARIFVRKAEELEIRKKGVEEREKYVQIVWRSAQAKKL